MKKKRTKTCIVTVYNSTNCGSYLQAYALNEVLSCLGTEVVFLRTGLKKNGLIFLKKTARHLKHLDFSSIMFDYKVLKNFKKKIKHFKVCKKTFNKEVALYILGSDEIWNASRRIMRNAPILWGEGLHKTIISYAPSVNNSTEEDIKKIKNVRELLEKMQLISVRDDYSKRIISSFTNKKIRVLCDPTFLIEREEYLKIQGKCPFENFILIYSAGGRFSDHDINNIENFAAKSNLSTVSFPHNLKWCNYQAPADPLDAIAFFEKANYVITDTFHGAALSIIFNKVFAAVPKENTKVTELLNYFNLPFLIKMDTNNLDVFFTNVEIVYDEVNQQIKQERAKAINYLKTAVEMNQLS